jgi:hypothetical protein
MDMDFQVFPYSLPEKEWYIAIQKHVKDTGEFVVVQKNNYVYKIQPDYPKFHCITQEVAKFSGTNMQGTKVLENNTRIYFQEGEMVRNARGRLGVVRLNFGPSADKGFSRVEWQDEAVEDVHSKSITGLKGITVALMCNYNLDACRKDKMRITCTVTNLQGRAETWWMVVIQPSATVRGEFAWINMATLQPMKSNEFQYWWAKSRRSEWSLQCPVRLDCFVSFWDSIIYRKPFQNPPQIPQGQIDTMTCETIEELERNTLNHDFFRPIPAQEMLFKILEDMYATRDELKDGATQPIPIEVPTIKF